MAAAKLRSDLSIVAQVYRGQESFVVKDLASAKYFRFGATEVRVMRCFDGQRSASEIAAALAGEGLRVTPNAVEGFARKLADAGFLERSLAERSTLQLERLRAERRQRRRPRLFRGEILRMRWSFGDPDSLLSKTLPGIRWMFTPGFIAASVVLFSAYIFILASQWGSFSAALQSTYSLHAITFTAGLTLWIVAGLVILTHELGHGFTCKYFGGEVRELGFMLLYFQPAFYCNVSDAWRFPQRRARMWVTAAGSWIQILLASLAALAWRAAAPGTFVANAALAAMLVGGVTTLLTNANPLLPLDGYFALSDWLEIPNLRHRAFEHLAWWFRQRVLRIELPERVATSRERRVFLIYAALSGLYIATIFTLLASLALGWAGRAFGFIGVAVGVGALAIVLRAKIGASVRAARLAVRTMRATVRRSRRWRRIPAVAAAIAIAALFLPWTLTTSGSFVVGPLSSHAITAPDSGVIAQVLVAEGEHVSAGAPLLRLADRALERELLQAGRSLDSAASAETAARASDRPDEAARAATARVAAAARVATLERRIDALTVRAPAAGEIVTPRPYELLGRWVLASDSLLVVATLDSVELRIAMGDAGATRVRAGQVVHAVSYADVRSPWNGRVASVSLAGVNTGRNAVEARVRRSSADGWRVGTSGEAKVDLDGSLVFGAIIWKARQLLRTDLWL